MRVSVRFAFVAAVLLLCVVSASASVLTKLKHAPAAAHPAAARPAVAHPAQARNAVNGQYAKALHPIAQPSNAGAVCDSNKNKLGDLTGGGICHGQTICMALLATGKTCVAVPIPVGRRCSLGNVVNYYGKDFCATGSTCINNICSVGGAIKAGTKGAVCHRVGDCGMGLMCTKDRYDQGKCQ